MAAHSPDQPIIDALAAAMAIQAETYSFDDVPEEAIPPHINSPERDDQQMSFETIVETTPARTIRGVMCRLTLILRHLDQDREVDRRLSSGGHEALYSMRDDLEFDAQQVLDAIRDLEAIDRLTYSLGEAWLDRWQALGGHFGNMYDASGKFLGSRMGYPMPYTWTPPTTHNPALAPHQWITERGDHAGAVKMLDSLLTLVPGLEEAVVAAAQAKGLMKEPEA